MIVSAKQQGTLTSLPIHEIIFIKHIVFIILVSTMDWRESMDQVSQVKMQFRIEHRRDSKSNRHQCLYISAVSVAAHA